MTGVAARPVVFDGPTGPTPGWWHAVVAPTRQVVVLCAPWGDEDIGAYRGLRNLAMTLADAGWPVLRFDLPGQGDSFDGPLASDAQLDAWPLWLACTTN